MVGEAGGLARAAVVGTGLIGGSVLLRLRAAGLDVAAGDLDPVARRQVRERGVAAPGEVEEAVAGRDVAFVLRPLPTLPATLARAAAATDDRVCSPTWAASGGGDHRRQFPRGSGTGCGRATRWPAPIGPV